MSGSGRIGRSAALARTVIVLAMLVACLSPVGAATAATPSGAKAVGAASKVAAADSARAKAHGKAPAEYRPGEVIVRYAPKASLATKRSANNKAGAASVAKLGRKVPGLSKVKLKKGVSVEEAVAAYKKQPGVLYAEPNYLCATSEMPDDPMFGDLWGLDNTGQSGGVEDADIDAPEAWDATKGSSDVVVAVIDTGIDYTHPDLVDNVWTNPGEIPGNEIDDDGNGYVDDVYGIDTYNGDSDPMDDFGHGTHCAGTIGATGNNGLGVTGVNWNVKLMAVKWIGADGMGFTDGAIGAIEYADMMGADLSSNSWHVFEYSQALYDTIAAVDNLLVFAAGNDSMNTDVWGNWPSAYDLPNILAVGANNRMDEQADFSNFGVRTVDVFAPGEEILSTVPGESYDWYAGTSMATPHVAGVAALLLSTNPDASWEALKLTIMASAEPRDSYSGLCLSGGRLNADLALDAVGGVPGTLTGTVTSSEGGPVEGAKVSVGDTLFAVTGADGTYSIPGIVPGSQSVVCAHPDYLAKVVTGVNIPADGTETLDLQLDLAGKIGGTVTAVSGGGGIEGIQVTAYRDTGEMWEPAMFATTAPDGTYTVGGLETGIYRVEFWDFTNSYVSQCYNGKPDLDSADDVEVTQGDTTGGIDAALQEYGHITGKVTAASTGAPVADAIVTGYVDTGGWWEQVTGTATAPDGTYDLSGLVTGTYRVEFLDGAGDLAFEYYSAKGSLARATPVSVAIGAITPNINATLDPAGKISGKVVAADTGDPIVEAFVSVYRQVSGSWEPVMIGAMTAEDGTYTLGGLRTGAYRVEFSDWTGAYGPEFYDGKSSLRTATAVGVRAGRTTRGINASLDPMGRISGTVTSASDGTPIGAAAINVWRTVDQGWEWMGGAEAAEDGTYLVESLPEGAYRVEFFDPSGIHAPEYYDGKSSLATADDVMVAAGATTENVDATMEPGGMISGTVTSADEGTPLEEIWATAYRSNGDYWEWIMDAPTGADGTYSIGGLGSGTYRVGFWDYSGVYAFEYYDGKTTLAEATDITVAAGLETSAIDATLELGGQIAGTVTAASDGSPLQEIWVAAYYENGSYWEPVSAAPTGSDGTYLLGSLQTGTYRVEFWDPYERYALEYYDSKTTSRKATPVTVTAGETTTDINATLDPAAKTKGGK